MPRNTSGVYTLPSGNPVVPGTVIDAAWANSTMEDMANEITNSLSRTGAGGMLAPFRIADGTITGPGLSYLNETNTGLYRSGAGSTWMAVLGVNVAQFSTVGLTIPFGKALTAGGNASVAGTLAVTGATAIASTLAVTGAITALGGVVGNVTGNVTAGSGTSTFNNITISGTLDMDAGSSATIINLPNPTNSGDAANKGYVDSVLGSKLSLTGGTMTGAIAMSNNKITGLATPTADQDAATKAYVDSIAQGLDAKASCLAATTANITLSGTQTIDGVAVTAGARVLVKNQSSAAQNGIYVAAAGAWSRAPDADTWDELVAAYTFIEQGTDNGNNGYICTISAGGTLGTTPVTWAQFSGAGQVIAGAGLTKTGNTLAVGTASSARIVVGADDIDLATTGVVAGTYKSVTVDAYGRVTGGSNPNTLAGYGITDAYTTTQVDTLVNAKLSLTGGTMSGAIAMGGFKITGLADPTNAQDAATKSYIDTIFGSTTTAAASAAAAAASATSANNAATSANNSATAAAGSATSAANSYTTFNNQYLGSKSSDPTVNNTGGALVAGNLYWNSTANEMRVYTGSAWLTAYLPATGYLALTGGTLTGNLGFNGTGLRITGDFTNATYSSRLMFQTSTANGATNVAALPNGTSAQSTFEVFGASDTTNAPFGRFLINATQVSLRAAINGTGAYLPFTLWTGGSERFRVNETTGNFLIGSSTDNGTDKLQVTGSMSLSSALRVGATPDAGTAGQVLTSAGAGAPPTWSAPPASAGTVTAVASGSLNAGQTVVINSNGTVSAVSGSFSSTLTYGGNVTFTGGSYTENNVVVYDATNQKIVAIYRDSNSYPVAIVGSVSSAGAISWGSPTVIVSSNCNNLNAIYLPDVGKVVVVGYYVATNSGAGWVGTVSGNTISFGSPGYYNFAQGGPIYNALAYDTVNQKIVVAYRAANYNSYGFTAVGAVSGTSISFDARIQFNSVTTIYVGAAYDVASGKVVLAYRDNDSSNIKSIVGTVSGTNMTFGAIEYVGPTSGSYVTAVYDTTAQKTVVMWVNASDGYAYANVGTVSGTSISFGGATAFTNSQTGYLSATYHVAAQKTAVTYSDGSNYGQVKLGTVSGTSISFGSAYTYSTGVSQFMSITYDSVNQLLPIVYALGAGSQVGTGNVGILGTTTNLTSSNFLGFSSTNYSNGQTATINTVGSSDNSQTGLTAGTKYYASAFGGVSTSVGQYSAYAGLAVSATKIVVKG